MTETTRRWRTLAAAATFCLFAATEASAQAGTVAGSVRDSRSGVPVVGARISVLGLDVGAVSQQEGSFLIPRVPGGAYTLSVTLPGYRESTREVSVVGDETLTVDLWVRRNALQLEEIVATGVPGEASRRGVGGTVTTVDIESVTSSGAARSLQDVLTGRVPGLRYTRVSGDVGNGSPMTLRGVGSFDLSRNQPLVYVDGMRVDGNVSTGPAVSSGPGVSVLDDIDPEEIDRVEILKGPAAAGLYGTEASAGVVHIITKRGRQGPPELTVSIRRGINYVSDPAGRLGTQWTCPSDASPGPTDCQSEGELLSYNMYDEATRYIAQGYFDWPTENLFRNGAAESYALSVRGGTPSIRYFLAAGYDDDQGAVWYNSDERLRARANVGVTLGEMVSLDVHTAFVDGRTRFMVPAVGEGGLWQDLVWSNGFFLDRVTPFSDASGSPRLGGFQEHLPSDVAEVESTRDYTRFTGRCGWGSSAPRLESAPFPDGSPLGPASASTRAGT